MSGKIALCLSGLGKSSMFSFPYIYESFIHSVPRGVDVYIHSYEFYRAISLYRPVKFKIDDLDVIDDLKSRVKLGDDVVIHGTANLTNILYMFNSITECFKLLDDEYDIIIRCRPDLLLQTDINFQGIITDLINGLYDIQIPGPHFNHTGLNDQLAIGNFESMKYYMGIFDNLEFLVNKYKLWHPETLLKNHIGESDYKIHQMMYDYSIVRGVDVKIDGFSKIKFLNL